MSCGVHKKKKKTPYLNELHNLATSRRRVCVVEQANLLAHCGEVRLQIFVLLNARERRLPAKNITELLHAFRSFGAQCTPPLFFASKHGPTVANYSVHVGQKTSCQLTERAPSAQTRIALYSTSTQTAPADCKTRT